MVSEAFRWYLNVYHKLEPEDLELTTSPGYWRIKGGCPGGDNCKHAFRGALGSCDGGGELTVRFAEFGVRDEKGRWVRPYREWETQRLGAPVK